ncbi:phage major capsid protein [Dongia deserti]|uniref:phage major capsid protein n=1 Tax=Dongia deserti TaxID=2268030 RepID=UPI0025495598|nr:hypothetical protein [Dongia deserti]
MSRVLVIGDELPARFIEAAGASIPTLGIVGPAALKEAAAGSYQHIMGLITLALRGVFAMSSDWDPWPYVKALFSDRVIVERDGKTWSYPYSYDQGTNAVTLGDPVEVIEVYQPVGMREALRTGAFIESAGKPGRYKIRVIKAGLSGNSNYYPDAVLREAVPLFDNARVFVKGDAEHLAGKGKDFRNLIGGLTEPKFVEGRGADSGEVQATFTLLNPSGPEAVKIREAWDSGLTNLFGFSIDAKGMARNETRNGRAQRTATKFTEVNSVDLIVEPGAGGRVIGLLEAKKDVIMDRTKIIALIEAKRPDLLQGKKVDQLSDEQLETLLTEAVAPAPAATPAAAPANAVTQDQLAEVIRMTEARAYARAAIAGCGLPDEAKTKLTAQVTLMAKFTEADIDKLIGDERTYIAKFTESGKVQLGGFPRIEMGETRAEKVAAMLDAFFDPSHKEHRHARSFRECYEAITGDHGITGRIDNCDQALLRESLDSGSFTNVLGNSITRRMIADYRNINQYDVWRPIITTPVPIKDFRTNERTRYGGYGDLPIVEEGAPYIAQSSPTDEKATYAVKKRGGTEDVTLEMIANDDVGAIRQIPIKLGRAAKRTLAKFVLDFIRTNPTIYDGVAFFHASHGNLGSAALDATSLAARRLAMVKQTELNSNDRIGVGPKYLLVPEDLKETAVNLFNRNTNNDKTFVQMMTLEILPIWYWTDTNDWALGADPMDVPGIEIGFLNGNEEPELFVQDAPTVGSMFTNDKVTWKLRHIYGGNALDFRAFDKSVVA